MTSSFGYYRFAEVDSGDYVSSKCFTFSQPRDDGVRHGQCHGCQFRCESDVSYPVFHEPKPIPGLRRDADSNSVYLLAPGKS